MVVLNMAAWIFALIALIFAHSGGPFPPDAPAAQAPAPRVVHVSAERFAFTPSEITVDEGTVIELRLTSDDTDHGFKLRGLGDHNVLIPKRGRGDVRLTIEAKQAGNYPFECSHVCGAGHGFMRGVIKVRPRSGSK
jgi:cytochrome c oxidase subunit 2